MTTPIRARIGITRAASIAVLVILALLATATSAFAGPPIHPRDEARDIAGFNHACGAAVDTEGDVYVASAGDDEIVVFDSAHDELTSIPNANEPCGLAVDTNGALYVSEKATGNVVRYKPNSYPFAGTPSFGGAEPIDSSGEAEGISVDPFDDRLYVARGDHVAVFNSDGAFGSANEVQFVLLDATGGTYTLSFEGETTDPLALEASSPEVQVALEGLSTIGSGNVSVTAGGDGHTVTFVGALAHTQVPEMVGDKSGLTGPGFGLFMLTGTQGFSGRIGDGTLSEATGVAAYTYRISDSASTRYIYAADAAGDEIEVFSGESLVGLKLRRTIEGVDHDANPATAEQELGFGAEGAYLAVDPGNRAGNGCASIAEQACTAGHVLLYDAANEAVEEFDATGHFLDRISSPDFEDAEPTGLAVERSGGPNDGTIYVTAGMGAGARLLAFAPLVAPSRLPLPALSQVLTGARAVTVDDYGDVYVASGPKVHVFGPDGTKLTEFEDTRLAYDLAVDSECNVYVLDGGQDNEQMTYYEPSACPPTPGTNFARREPPIVPSVLGLKGVAVNPADDHVFLFGTSLGSSSPLIEFDSAQEGSAQVGECGIGVSASAVSDLAVDGSGGGVIAYVARNPGFLTGIDCLTDEVVAETGFGPTAGGGGCPSGIFGNNPRIAVDQSNGHLLEFYPSQPGNSAREYDSALSCVAEYGQFSGGSQFNNAIAVDNGAQSPNRGTVYVAFDGLDNGVQPFDLTAFGPLSYGEAPAAETGVANGFGAGAATLNGTVDPRGFELDGCAFEYLPDSEYEANLEAGDPGFQGSTAVDCAETPAQIGNGTGAVSVHADIAGLDAEGRYRFRLSVENKYGKSLGDAGLFGSPLIATKAASPVFYDEATLRAQVDPSGLETTYRFQYGTTTSYGKSTPALTLPPGDGPVAVEAPLIGLQEGTTYHFRIVVSNEANDLEGPDQTFATQQRTSLQGCSNTEYRIGLSAKLPDCRAYELVTPADMGGKEAGVTTPPSSSATFNSWMSPPRGTGAGERLSFFSGTLPGFEGAGDNDGYRVTRSPGSHPNAGWTTELVSPTYAQYGIEAAPGNHQEGVAADQLYSLWETGLVKNPGTLPNGHFLRTPDGFEQVGQGSLGTDPKAESRFVSAGGAHVLFFSKAHLEPTAAPEGTTALYDRQAGNASAAVISVKPGGDPFGAGEDAAYVGTNEDGTGVLFRIGGTLYLHRDGQTTAIATAPNTFAGISEDGTRVFYMDAAIPGDATPPAPASLYACDTGKGPCAGSDPVGRTLIAPESIFVSVSPGGSRVLFTSEEVLDDAEAGTEGAPNLYAWDGTGTDFVAVLHPQDLIGFGFENVPGEGEVDLLAWARAINPGQLIGRANSPTRATPDGEAFLFQSHARLTAYDNEGVGQIYRYEPGAPPAERLICVSCDPSGAPPSGDAMLQIYGGNAGGHTLSTTLIANITDDGSQAFFHSPDRLRPDDANSTTDVYQWKANGTGCKRPEGCLALISSGQGEEQSTLFGMSADGDDVFFSTPEKLVPRDIPGSSSLYDARVNGGIPDPPAKAPCQGDACQGQGSVPPTLAAPASAAVSGASNPPSARPRSRCPKGKRGVKRKGKVRCVKRKRKATTQRRANRNRGGKR